MGGIVSVRERRGRSSESAAVHAAAAAAAEMQMQSHRHLDEHLPLDRIVDGEPLSRLEAVLEAADVREVLGHVRRQHRADDRAPHLID